MAIGTEATETLEQLCLAVAKEFPKSIVFTGKLIFREEKWYQRLLHNETAAALQRKLQFDAFRPSSCRYGCWKLRYEIPGIPDRAGVRHGRDRARVLRCSRSSMLDQPW
jgi:hypothetical protein